jgi:hypothetical protein
MTQQQDGQQRDRPYHELDAARIGEVGQSLRALVGSPKPPGERPAADYGGNDDHQHDRQRIEKNGAIRTADGSNGVQYGGRTARQRERQRQGRPESFNQKRLSIRHARDTLTRQKSRRTRRM